MKFFRPKIDKSVVYDRFLVLIFQPENRGINFDVGVGVGIDIVVS